MDSRSRPRLASTTPHKGMTRAELTNCSRDCSSTESWRFDVWVVPRLSVQPRVTVARQAARDHRPSRAPHPARRGERAYEGRDHPERRLAHGTGAGIDAASDRKLE